MSAEGSSIDVDRPAKLSLRESKVKVEIVQYNIMKELKTKIKHEDHGLMLQKSRIIEKYDNLPTLKLDPLVASLSFPWSLELHCY